MPHAAHYDPLQPRVPRHHEGGGRWTREGDESVQLAFAPPPGFVIQKGIEAALAFFAWLSIHNSRSRQAVVGFNARAYQGEEGVLDLAGVRRLDRDDVNDACKLETVQELTDSAAQAAIMRGPYRRPADYGTAVHATLKRWIDAIKEKPFKAEVSYIKMQQEGVYGEKGSIRVDVLEQLGNRTVCVYDIKTGRSGLTPRRVEEIARHVFGAYPDTLRIIVTEVRPTVAR